MQFQRACFSLTTRIYMHLLGRKDSPCLLHLAADWHSCLSLAMRFNVILFK